MNQCKKAIIQKMKQRDFKRQLLPSQKWKSNNYMGSNNDSTPKVIKHFGRTNNIFADCI